MWSNRRNKNILIRVIKPKVFSPTSVKFASLLWTCHIVSCSLKFDEEGLLSFTSKAGYTMKYCGMQVGECVGKLHAQFSLKEILYALKHLHDTASGFEAQVVFLRLGLLFILSRTIRIIINFLFGVCHWFYHLVISYWLFTTSWSTPRNCYSKTDRSKFGVSCHARLESARMWVLLRDLNYIISLC